MDKETHSSKIDKPKAEEKAIDPTVCELCGATSEHVEILSVGPREGPRYRGLCAPHFSLLSWLVKEILYSWFFEEGLEKFVEHYKGRFK